MLICVSWYFWRGLWVRIICCQDLRWKVIKSCLLFRLMSRREIYFRMLLIVLLSLVDQCQSSKFFQFKLLIIKIFEYRTLFQLFRSKNMNCLKPKEKHTYIRGGGGWGDYSIPPCLLILWLQIFQIAHFLKLVQFLGLFWPPINHLTPNRLLIFKRFLHPQRLSATPN